jgi:hypothetical protein
MTQLAAPMTLAAALAMVIAALRLWTDNDPERGRHHVVLTVPLIVHIFLSSVCHGAASLFLFLPYGIWPDNWRVFLKIDPWAIALFSPFIVNGLLSLEGFDVLKALGTLGKFANDINEAIKQDMVQAEDIALSELINPLAKGEQLFIMRQELLDGIPMMLSIEKANACRAALNGATTVKQAMELFIRHVGKRKFLALFDAKLRAERPALAPTPLFDA